MPRGNKILIRSGTTTPSASDFVTNEPAWDRTAKKLYVKAGDGTMVEVGGAGATEILEYATTASFPATGTAARIYIATDASRAYRWDSSGVYVEIGAISAYDSRWNLFVPPAPTNVSGTVANGQSAVTWTAPTVSAQTPIIDYVVQYSTSPFNSWTTFSDGTSTATSATVTGLTNGTAYQFRVAAVNGVGTGAYSSSSASVTPTAGDASWASVKLLLHADGADDGTTFTDSSAAARTVTRGGSAVTKTGTKKYGTAAAYFAASGDYLSLADNSALELGGSDFAIEMWINTTSSTQYATLISRTPNAFGAGMWSLMTNHDSSTAGDLALYVFDANSGTSPLLLGGSGLRDGAWHHIAVSRSGSSWGMYVDGTRVATATNSSTIGDISGGINVGRDEYYGRQFVGYIDDLRLTIGAARYTASTLTVPTAAFPDY